MPLAESFVSSVCQDKTDITLKSGQGMLFLLLLQGSYSQCTPFLFHLVDWASGYVRFPEETRPLAQDAGNTPAHRRPPGSHACAHAFIVKSRVRKGQGRSDLEMSEDKKYRLSGGVVVVGEQWLTLSP